MEHGEVGVGAFLPAGEDAAEAIQPGMGGLDDPAAGAEAGFVLDRFRFFAAATDVGGEAELVEQLAYFVSLITATRSDFAIAVRVPTYRNTLLGVNGKQLEAALFDVGVQLPVHLCVLGLRSSPTLWISLITRHSAAGHRIAGAAALSLIGLVVAAIVVEQPTVTREALAATPLRQVVQLNPSLIARAHALLDERPGDRRAIEAERLLDQFAPGLSRVAVVTPADWATQALIRAHRGNLLPIAVLNQYSLLPARSLLLVNKRLSRLGPGSVVLTTKAYLDQPPRDASELVFRETDDFELVVLSEIRRLFRFRVAATTPDGLVVLELESK